MPQLGENLRREYDDLFNRCLVLPAKANEVESIVSRILVSRSRYEAVAKQIGMPWFLVGVIHNMESSLDFSRHLHNGDPLTARTVNVPEGYPRSGNPPFTWEESAIDSLRLKKFHLWKDYTLPGILFKLEEYNGWGYRSKHPEVLSPYLWSGSNHYSKGKYVSDGIWSDTAVSRQCGAAVLLRRMAEKGMISFPGIALPETEEEPMVAYSTEKTPFGRDLQLFLNTMPGIYLKVDGITGQKTSDAVKKVFGFYLKADPRE